MHYGMMGIVLWHIEGLLLKFVHIPSFLGGINQLTAAEVKESQIIASVRIHVERAIQTR